jgi:hypothetical protein
MAFLVHRLERAFRSRNAFRELLVLSGIEREDLRAFIQACAHSAQVPTNEVVPQMIALFSRYVQEWRSVQKPSLVPRSERQLPKSLKQLAEPYMWFPELEAQVL